MEGSLPLARKEVPVFEQKRPYTVEDIRLLQRAFLELIESQKRTGKRVSFGAGFYQYLTTGTFLLETDPVFIAHAKEIIREEGTVDREEMEAFLCKTYLHWRYQILHNEKQIIRDRPKLESVVKLLHHLPEPKTGAEVKDLYRQNVGFEELCPATYQGGLGEEGMITAPFLHIKGHRVSGYAYEQPQTTVRLYACPVWRYLPEVAEELTGRALLKNIPFYFKVFDTSVNKNITASDVSRVDRLLIYTDVANTQALVEILQEMSARHPEWFSPHTPPLTAPVAKGIGFAEDPTPEQDKAFGGFRESTSFNAIRAEFLEKVWLDVGYNLLAHHGQIRPRNGRTLEQIFITYLERAVKENPYVVADVGSYEKILALLRSQGFRPKRETNPRSFVSTLEVALQGFIVDVIPSIAAESLFDGVKQLLPMRAREYGIHVDNLARNAPISKV